MRGAEQSRGPPNGSNKPINVGRLKRRIFINKRRDVYIYIIHKYGRLMLCRYGLSRGVRWRGVVN